jgi:4-hydroxy-2-oxoheptanedioate aldolase
VRENRLRKLLSEGKPSLGTRLQSSWPTVTEIVGRSQKFDYIEFLAEYAPYDLYALDNLGRAIELFPNFTGLIKMEQSAQAHLAIRAMAAGIQNLMFTDVRSAAEARECVRIVRPETPEAGGTHGNAAGRAATGGLPAIVQEYNDAVIVLMIEKKGAVENLEEILAVPGIDMVQFGPSDYSMSIGQAGQRTSPQVVEAREYTIRTALKMGVQPRAELTEASEAEYYVKLGVKHFCMAADTTILARYYAEQGTAMREIIGKL